MARDASCPRTALELEQRLSCPTPEVAADLARVEGDLVLLGAGGKMGPTLARMARRALDEGGEGGEAAGRREVIAVSRFSDPGARAALESHGVRTIACDLTRSAAVERLPDAGALLFLAGRKFGTGADIEATWDTNALAPALVARRYGGVPTVVFSSGNVYPFVDVESGGATEETAPGPVGEYALSVLGREAVFEDSARERSTPTLLLRLNYAVELRYGVLVDVARRVLAREPIDLAVGYVNVLWQADASNMALRALGLARSPARALNVTGAERVSIRAVAERFAQRFDRPARLEGVEGDTALLSDASLAHRLLAAPTVPVERLVDWTAEWLAGGGVTWDLPTHYEVTDGDF